MKRASVFFLVVLVLWSAVWAANAEAASVAALNERTVIFEDESFIFWTVPDENGKALELWREDKAIGPWSAEIVAPFVKEAREINGLIFFVEEKLESEEERYKSAFGEFIDDPALQAKMVNMIIANASSFERTYVFFIGPGINTDKKNPPKIEDYPGIDDIVLAGTYGEQQSAFVVYQTKKGLFVWALTQAELPFVKGLGKYHSVHLHSAGYLYLVNAKGELAICFIEEKQPLRRIGKIRKGTLPVDGENYLGWLTEKNELAYSQDGATVRTIPPLPKEAVIEFYQGFMIIKYDHFWIAKVIPGQYPAAISQAEYDLLCAENTLLSPYPEAQN